MELGWESESANFLALLCCPAVVVPVLGNENENIVYLSEADVPRNSNAVYRRKDGHSLGGFFFFARR
jgi:hypothetical protein